MTSAQRPIIEDELHAYVDGMLEPGRRAEVERYLHAVFSQLHPMNQLSNHSRFVGI